MGLAGGGLGATLPHERVGEACYARIRTNPDATTDIFEALAEMEELSEVALISGADDLLAEVQGSWGAGARVVLERLASAPGVRSTNTLVAVPALRVGRRPRRVLRLELTPGRTIRVRRGRPRTAGAPR